MIPCPTKKPGRLRARALIQDAASAGQAAAEAFTSVGTAAMVLRICEAIE